MSLWIETGPDSRPWDCLYSEWELAIAYLVRTEECQYDQKTDVDIQLTGQRSQTEYDSSGPTDSVSAMENVAAGLMMEDVQTGMENQLMEQDPR